MWCRDGQDSGEFKDIDAVDFSITFSALLDGFAVQIALDDPVVDPERAFQASMGFASQQLGFAWKPPKSAGPGEGSGKTARSTKPSTSAKKRT